MKNTLEKYRQAIQENRANVHVRWDGQHSRTIFDPADPNVPLEVLAFGAYRLEEGPFTVNTGDREYILAPIDGRFEVKVGDQTFTGERRGGPFATEPHSSNACAVYIGRDQQFELAGRGEAVWFSAPADKQMPPVYVKPGQEKQLSRGKGIWRRDVITMITPGSISTNMTMGETYSPAGLWSGTPLHTHDQDAPEIGETDLEEVYYHLARVTDGQWGAYGVQLLFDEKGMDKAYIVHDRDAIAIPGGAHPVVAGPVSDMLYVWALAGRPGSDLMMRDVPEFAHLKAVERILDKLEKQRGTMKISQQQFEQLAGQEDLKGEQVLLLRQFLCERGIEVR